MSTTIHTPDKGAGLEKQARCRTYAVRDPFARRGKLVALPLGDACTSTWASKHGTTDLHNSSNAGQASCTKWRHPAVTAMVAARASGVVHTQNVSA
jgi:hypothetical protein